MGLMPSINVLLTFGLLSPNKGTDCLLWPEQKYFAALVAGTDIDEVGHA